MPSPTWIRIVIGLLAAAMLGLALLTGDSIDQEGLRWIGGITSAITLALLAFDRWIWRWPYVRWLSEATGSRVIHGTWRGAIDYVTDGDGNPGTTAVYMAIHQTYSELSVRCYFPLTGSTSISLTATLEAEAHRHLLRYLFQQQARAPDLDHNRPTQGACELVVVGRPVEELAGSYFSERGGKGTIAFDGYSPKIAGSGPQAGRLTYTQLPS